MENKFVQFDLLQVKDDYLAQKSVLNLPNGMVIENLKMCGTMVNASMVFVPNINYVDGQFKEIA